MVALKAAVPELLCNSTFNVPFATVRMGGAEQRGSSVTDEQW